MDATIHSPDVALLDQVAESTGALVSILTPDGRLAHVSPNHYALLGIRPDEQPDTLDESWLHPDDRDRVLKTVARMAPTGGSIEYRVRTLDGRVVWIATHFGPADLPGAGLRIVSISHVIDEHAHTRDRLAESEARYRMLAESASDVLWMMDTDLVTRYMSPAVLHQLGFTPEEYIALPIDQRLPPESVRTIRETFVRELAVARDRATRGEHHRFSLEMLHRHRDGHLIWGDVQMAFIYDDAMNITGIHGVTRNIDDRKRAEDALARSEAHYRRFFQENRAGLAMCEAIRDGTGRFVDARYLEVNEAYGTQSGLPVERVLGRLASQIFDAEELASGLAILDRIFRGETVRLELHSSATGRWLDSTAWSLGDDRYIVMFEDVSARKRLEEEVGRVQKLESIGLLAGGIAHDFNNILTGILGNLSLVRLMSNPDPRLSPLLESAEEACGRARDLTQQLLTFSRGGDPVKANASLPELIRQAADFVLTGSNVSCTYRFAPVGLHAPVDRGQIAQVVQNLVINAIQAMPDGGRLEIETDRVDLAEGGIPYLPAGSYVRFLVRDSGHGIPPEHREKLFDPYFTTREHGQGLGLPVSFSIVRKHGGYITVDSEVGKGAMFTVYLPASREMVATEGPAAPSEAVQRRRVLLMDDDPSVREVLAKMLTLLGYEATSVRDGQEAIRMYERHLEQGAPFDLVLMDLTVPGGMGGKVAIREILARDPGARAIVTSGYSTDPVMANHTAHGFKAVLPKPVNLPDLARVLIQALGESG